MDKFEPHRTQRVSKAACRPSNQLGLLIKLI